MSDSSCRVDYRKVLLVRVASSIPSSTRNMPMGLMALAAYVREKQPEFQFQILDQTVDNRVTETAIVEKVAQEGIGVLGLNVLTCTAREADEVARTVKARSPGTIIVVGGPHPSTDPEGSLREPAIDFGIGGEGEIPFNGFLASLVSGGDPGDIPGVLARRPGGVNWIAPGAVIEDLDQLPRPAFDLIEPRVYWKHQGFAFVGHRPYFPLFTSRGCPYQCTFCHKVFGSRFRVRSPQKLIEDVEDLARRYGVREFEILDDAFNINEGRALEFLDDIRTRLPGSRLLFPNGLRTDRISHAFIDAMVRAGVTWVSIAVESASPRIQKLIKKNLDIEKVRDNIEYASRRGIFCYGYFIVGFPTETAAELKMTVDFACSSRLHAASFFLLTPFPGTQIWQTLQEEQRATLSQVDSDCLQYCSNVLNLTAVSDEGFRRIQRNAFLRFYLNPWRLIRLLWNHPHPVPAVFLGARQILLRLAGLRAGHYV